MTKFYITIFSLILISSSSLSQNKIWGESGARWRYDLSGHEPPNVYEIEKNRDTIIQGKKCEIYRTTKYNFSWGPDPEPSYYGSEIFEKHITHVSGDTVFFFHSNSFHILYNFNAGIGDTWNLGLIDTIFNCPDPIVKVIGKGERLINGELTKYIDVSMSDSTLYIIGDRIFEAMGPGPKTGSDKEVIAYLFPKDRYNTACQFMTSIPIWKLKCYKDDFFPLFETSTNWGGLFLDNCEINFSIGIDELKAENQISVYPSPFNVELNIELHRNINSGRFVIYDVLGSLKLSGNYFNSEKLSINTHSLNSGLYLLKIFSDNSVIGIARILKK